MKLTENTTVNLVVLVVLLGWTYALAGYAKKIEDAESDINHIEAGLKEDREKYNNNHQLILERLITLEQLLKKRDR